MKTRQPPVFALMGTTATGKTELAAALTESLPMELVSVDSSLVYTGMDVGTAKPDDEFLTRYPHALINIREPADTYSAADFCADARAEIHRIVQNGNIPLLVGGTNFYFAALESGLPDLPAADPELRERILARAQRDGWPALHARLAEQDPARAKRIDPNDAQRIQRALEIIELTGERIPESGDNVQSDGLDLCKMALAIADRRVLHQRIEQRFDQMIDTGLEQEVAGLLKAGVPVDCVAMKMIGYRQMTDYILGNLGFDAMRAAGIAATRQLAKRQLTWLRQQRGLTWFVSDGLNSINNGMITEFVKEKAAVFGL